jgi:hypothetical protein
MVHDYKSLQFLMEHLRSSLSASQSKWSFIIIFSLLRRVITSPVFKEMLINTTHEQITHALYPCQNHFDTIISKRAAGRIERLCWVVSIPALYSGSPGFKSRPKDRTSWLRIFVIFLSFSRIIPRYYLKLGHDRFFAHPFQFVIK